MSVLLAAAGRARADDIIDMSHGHVLQLPYEQCAGFDWDEENPNMQMCWIHTNATIMASGAAAGVTQYLRQPCDLSRTSGPPTRKHSHAITPEKLCICKPALVRLALNYSLVTSKTHIVTQHLKTARILLVSMT